MMESKKEIYDLIPPEYYPTTILIASHSDRDNILEKVADAGIPFPLIAKPDIGLRGSAVKKIHTPEELLQYNAKADFNYLVQALIPYQNEVGIFYVRYPDQPSGKITGIVAKEFMIVTGDGNKTIEQLVMQNPRYALKLNTLQKEYGAKLQDVLPKGVLLNLVPYGNHARGSKFIDATHWATPELERQVDAICQKISGFYFGRIDIMYNSVAEMEQGKNVQIVEINGASSEPTHIYDPKHTIFFAWKELFRHITMMYEISVINYRRGFPYLQYKEGMAEYRKHVQQEKRIVNF